LDHKEVKKDSELLNQLKAYQYEPTFYVKPNFNKLGKEKLQPNEEFKVDHWSIEELAEGYFNEGNKLQSLDEKYKKAKIEMEKCTELKQKRKLAHKYGSVSLIQNDPLYDVIAIYEDFGEEILIRYGKPDAQKLEEFVIRGIITKNDIEQFKTLVDIHLDFVIMSLDTEQKIYEMLQQRNIQASLNRRRA
jgi:hypothetical protein